MKWLRNNWYMLAMLGFALSFIAVVVFVADTERARALFGMPLKDVPFGAFVLLALWCAYSIRK